MIHVPAALDENPVPKTWTTVPMQPEVGVRVIMGSANALSTPDRVRRTNRVDKTTVRDATAKLIRCSFFIYDGGCLFVVCAREACLVRGRRGNGSEWLKNVLLCFS
jgi:hypothetical protein